MGTLIDRIGMKYGKLTVIALAPQRAPDGQALWVCSCSCGGSRIVCSSELKRTKSCGCLTGRRTPHRHGYAKHEELHPLYDVWKAMRQRCNNPNHRQFKNYGGRGIKVCERWNNFANFLADMGERPHPRLVLDRHPDNNGNYEPYNVRWATYRESVINRRPSKIRTDNRSGITGVSQVGRYWVACINHNNKRIHLGTFDTIEAAAEARCRANGLYRRPLRARYDDLWTNAGAG
jgi:hypothetical protein